MKKILLPQARHFLSRAAAVTLLGSACPVMAQVTLLQSDPTGTFSFNSDANWSDGLAPSAGKTYSVTGTSDTTFILRAPQNGTFAGDSLSINNRGSLAWAPPGSTGTPTGTLTINNFILNGGSIANFRTGGTLILAGNISVTAESTLQIGSTANTTPRNMTLNASINGSSRLRVNASGTGSNVLTVNGDNSNFSGGFELLGGSGSNNTTTVGHAKALGTGTTTVTQGILNLNGYSVSIGGLAGTNASDSFVQNNSGTAAVLTVNSSADTSYAGVIRNGTGNVALTKSGAATLTLGGANSYTGTTTIGAGTLALGNNDVLPDSSNLSLGTATLDAATYSDAHGTLDVTGTATIHLGSGAQLAFADSSGGGTGTWTGTLNLTGTFVPGNGVDPGVGTNSGSLRFANGNGLTAAQLSKITATGWTAFALDAFGYLTATPVVGDSYLSWAASQVPPVSGGETGDHDNDGVENLVEYALADGQERGVFSGNTITFSKRGAPYGSDLTYILETSETLSNPWTPVVTHGPEVLGTNPTITYTLTPGPGKPKDFVRLRVVRNP